MTLRPQSNSERVTPPWCRPVDLRGRRVAAVAADIYEFTFSQTVAGKQRHSFLSAASEGDSDEHTRGLTLGAGGALWALTDLEHETLTTPAGPDQESTFRATDLAVDGTQLYLVVPGTGIVVHDFAP